ncbi:hypothetical protein [Chitinimonas sp.]|uniref:hypothetical protein n=1 Tax=Chitinimonas sp. TaxID=1934313 RepID=UPI0035B172A8
MSRARLALLLLGSMLMATAGSLIALGHALLGSPDRAMNTAIGNDQALNAALGGSPDETLSSRANRARAEGRRWGCLLCRLLDRIQPNHCRDSSGI